MVFTAQSSGTIEIGGATIVIYDPNGNAIVQGTSATSGVELGSYTLSFEGQLNVNYTVVVSADNYAATTDTISFTNNLNATIISLLNDASSVPTIYGRVVDQVTGLGLAYANISITGTNTVVNVSTMSDGTFLAYDSFQTGVTYTVVASKLGYDTNEIKVQIPTTSLSSFVSFVLGQNTSNLTSIVGRVIVEGSSPVAGIANALIGLFVINESATPNEKLVATALSDQYGSYTFTNVTPEKNYIIKAIKIINTNTQSTL